MNTNTNLPFYFEGLRIGHVKSLWLYRLGYTCATLMIDKRSNGVSLSKTLKDISVELFFETQEHEMESLVMWIITHGEIVPESSTYRPYAMETI